ncbi:MAG: hypothetical protein JWR80_6009 [Bradyrhizobium sp.]|nr:hypothetical protein [Bradyrhizobium sp.]
MGGRRIETAAGTYCRPIRGDDNALVHELDQRIKRLENGPIS